MIVTEPSGTRNKLTATQVRKTYRSVAALRGVDLEVSPGEVMGLVGENGAGKSTLIKVISGMTSPDAGSIELDGAPQLFASRAAAQAAGIAVVEQELSMVPTMSIADNVFLGNRARGRLRRRGAELDESRRYLERVGLRDLDPRTRTSELLVAQKQLVEIARLLAHEAQLLILDEPTAALDGAEIEVVKEVVRSLSAEGRSVVYVSHHLDEIFDLTDRITVLRDGESHPPVATARASVGELVQMMLGRSIGNLFPERGRAPFGTVVIEARGLVTPGITEPVSLSVRRGEMLGLAGQMGSGAASLLRCFGGAQKPSAGETIVGSRERSIYSPRAAKRAGIAFCSGDRKSDGFFGVRTVRENLVVPAIESVTPHGIRSPRAERRLSRHLANAFQVDQSRLSSTVETLSGGNQQKVALGKWIGIEPQVLLIDQPTRGVDVGARAEIYLHLRRLADEGLAVIFASADVQEIVGLSDTVATFYHGRLVRVLDRDAVDVETVTRDVTHPERVAR